MLHRIQTEIYQKCFKHFWSSFKTQPYKINNIPKLTFCRTKYNPQDSFQILHNSSKTSNQCIYFRAIILLVDSWLLKAPCLCCYNWELFNFIYFMTKIHYKTIYELSFKDVSILFTVSKIIFDEDLPS